MQSSSDPFLAWDDLRRSASRRSVVAYDLATRRTRELIPEGMIASYTLVAGDSVIVYNEDVTTKTDYDVIFGTENRMMARTQVQRVAAHARSRRSRARRSCGRKTAAASRTERRAASTSGRRETAAAGRSPDRPARAGAIRASSDTSAAARERRARERFTPVRFSAAGDLLLLSNRQGLWVADVATGDEGADARDRARLVHAAARA